MIDSARPTTENKTGHSAISQILDVDGVRGFYCADSSTLNDKQTAVVKNILLNTLHSRLKCVETDQSKY